MPYYRITITYLNPTLKTVSGIREGISLKHTHDVYLRLAKKWYHDLVSFDIVEVEKPKYEMKPKEPGYRSKDRDRGSMEDRLG